MKPNEYTVCITNFSRPDHLGRCLDSVSGVENVVVASYGAGPSHEDIINQRSTSTPRFVTEEDHGCNRLWIQAVEMAKTPWVVILHDDDMLSPKFPDVIGRADLDGMGFAGWNGVSHYYGGKPDVRAAVWGTAKPGPNPTMPLLRGLTNPHGSFVKSPVTMMLQRDLALTILKWCEINLKDSFTRPSMMIGNEIALLYGHAISGTRWLHLPESLVRFGNWEGSETVKHLNGSNPELMNLYNKVRVKLGTEKPIF